MTEDDGWTSSEDAGWTAEDDDYRARTYRSGDGWAVPEWRPTDEELERELAGVVEEEVELAAECWIEFGAYREAGVEALLGSEHDAVIPANGTIMIYGDGGAGKTTLALDLAAHLAAGRPWLELDVARPCRSLFVENEGPRARFRQIVNEKVDALADEEAARRLFAASAPWGEFTLADDRKTAGLARLVVELDVDVIVLGPLATLGTIGGGTPDEVSAFEKKLRAFRELVGRPIAIVLLHHENKAGDVSGAWERVPDTLLHVQARGNGRTSIVFRKTRWSSSLHGTTLNLKWSDGRAFEVVPDEDARDYHAEILAVFEENDGWRTAKETREAIGGREVAIRAALDDLVGRGELEFVKGPPGRHPTAQCYRLRSATVLELAPRLPISPDDDPLEF